MHYTLALHNWTRKFITGWRNSVVPFSTFRTFDRTAALEMAAPAPKFDVKMLITPGNEVGITFIAISLFWYHPMS